MDAKQYKILERKLEREERARAEAERLLEEKSQELYFSKKELEISNQNKEVYLRVLNRFAMALTNIETEEELLWYVAREVVANLGFNDCVFYIYDPARGVIEQRAAIERKNPSGEEIVNPLVVPLGQGITGTVAKTRQAELVDDVAQDPRYIDDIDEPGSELCVPVEHDGQLYGVLDSESPKKGFFTKMHKDVMQTVAAYAAAKIAERRKQAELERRSADLEEKVILLTALKEELEIAKEKAEETSALKSRFVATISHEIRTPLAGILGSLDLLQDENLSGRAAGLLTMARDSGVALQTLLNDVIDFARSEAGTLLYEPTAFSLTDVIASVQSVWHPHLEAKGFEFKLNLQGAFEQSYWGDPARIRQILNNYMSNAIKYAGGGSLVLNVEKQDDMLKFSLVDQGPGLSAEDQDNLFKEFSRVGAYKRQIGEGAGLGLAICKQIAELMDGTVGVESDGSNGSAFWFAIPLRPATPEEDKGRSEAVNYLGFLEKYGRRPRILVAEDVPTNQTLIRMMLEAFDCRVTIVGNGVEAVEAVRAHDYDLVFMDIAMPEMDGTAATKRIYQIRETAHVPPIYALTAHGMDEDREEFEAAGMKGIVTKPFDRADLYVTIDGIMQAAVGSTSMMQDGGSETVNQPDLEPDFDKDMVLDLLTSLDETSRDFLLKQCVADIEKGLHDVTEGLQKNDPEKVAGAAHRLKSVTGTFGLKKIQHVSADVNDLFRAGSTAESTEAAQRLEALLPDGIAALKDLGTVKEGAF